MTALGILVVALVAGVLGALLGLGGGIIVIPGLTLALGFGMQEAIGASLMGVIASSTGAAVRYVKQGYVNVRLGMLLETATTTGAIIGALVAVYLDQDLLAILFSIVLVYGAFHMLTRKEKVYRPEELEAESQLLDLSCTYVDQKNGEEVCYGVKRYRTGLLASLAAGGLSGLLGVGGRRHQGAGHERLHVRAHEGGHGHEQLHDRRHRPGRGDNLCPLRLSGPDTGGADRHGRAGRRRGGLQIDQCGGGRFPPHHIRGPAPRGGGPHGPQGPGHIGGGVMPSQERMNQVIHKVLLAGVVVSMTLIGVGLFLTATTSDAEQEWIGLGSLWDALVALEPVALVELGLLVLIATPLLRILAALVLFTTERDYRFILIALFVLGMVSLAVVIDI